MANGTFFTSWQLWEEMTFVLAMGIVIVFFIGLIKLWLANRHMRKYEQLDTEKQARIAQMRKSGLSVNGRSRLGTEIPFGVKALEGGVEVEGIWIARMASMASRPPDRKWSSRRKIRPAPALLADMSELGGPNKRSRRGSRGSRRSSKISRREIVEPSKQTREKLENLSLLEEERQSGDWAGRDKSTAENIHNRQAHYNTSQPGHMSTLGRIQRSLKKVTSSDTWREQAGRQGQESRRLDAKQFHEGAQAKKPQRFYPGPDSSAKTTPLVAPQAKSHATRQQVNSLLSNHQATQVQVPHAPGLSRVERGFSDQSFAVRQGHDARQQTSNDTPDSSAESFVTSVEVPQEPSAPSQASVQDTGISSEGESMAQTHPYSVPRRSSSLRRNQGRRTSSEGRGSLDRGEHSSAASAQRYPPNSSRSGPVVQTRTQSSTQQQQKHRTAPTAPSPSSGLGEVYANTSKRKVNANFEVLPAGTFGFSDQQQYGVMPRSETTSSAGSAQSSFDSRSSSGRKKLQKKKRSQS